MTQTKSILELENDIKQGNIYCHPPRLNKYKAKSSIVTLFDHKTNSPLKVSPKYQISDIFSDTKPRAPFGVSKPFDPTKKSNRLTLKLSIRSPEDARQFQLIDSYCKKIAMDNCKEWFGEKKASQIKPEFLEMMYRPCLTESFTDEKGNTYDPTLSTKVQIGSHMYGTRYFKVKEVGVDDGEKQFEYESAQMTDITPHSYVIPIIEWTGMWFSSQQFGPVLKCTDIIIFNDTRPEFPFSFGPNAVFQKAQEHEDDKTTGSDSFSSESSSCSSSSSSSSNSYMPPVHSDTTPDVKMS